MHVCLFFLFSSAFCCYLIKNHSHFLPFRQLKQNSFLLLIFLFFSLPFPFLLINICKCCFCICLSSAALYEQAKIKEEKKITEREKERESCGSMLNFFHAILRVRLFFCCITLHMRYARTPMMCVLGIFYLDTGLSE